MTYEEASTIYQWFHDLEVRLEETLDRHANRIEEAMKSAAERECLQPWGVPCNRAEGEPCEVCGPDVARLGTD